MKNKEYRISFVILNYQTYWETFKCVESIKEMFFSQEYELNTSIIIVDNGSSNESAQKLKDKYITCDNVHVLETGKNLGFAKGNNVGFAFAKTNLQPDFILMVNSDVVMNDKEFATKLISNYNKVCFDVAGPNITLPDGNRINPFLMPDMAINVIESEIKKLERHILYTKLKIDPFIVFFSRIPKLFKDKKIAATLPKESFELTSNYALHGCFLVFSKRYIEKFDGLYDKTFLYEEECLLKLRCERSKMKMYFLSDLNALHNESQTEKFIGGKINLRHRRRYINMLQSMRVLRNYIESSTEI